jgi:hypothetical protein
MTTNNNDDVLEFASIGGVLVDLSTVSHNLRSRFHAAARAAGKGDKARDELKRIGEVILAEQAPAIAEKAFRDAHKRSRVNGAAAIAKLLGFQPSK